ncbi:MAG: DNA mismatch repair endonuclease MutL [Desulfitobacteriaceae bacterium]
MTHPIHVLDEHAANQIAAGEVVERPLSVVKELIENALDAGASRIEISVERNGVPLIAVSDNGHGIPSAELPLALLRHATSKLTHIEDLNTLRTLGFRGEALPSIASVSLMEISTRSQNELSGAVLKVQGGQQMHISDAGRPEGTTVTVRDLFFNTPARRKFLKSVNTEFGLISDMVSRLALARPDVAFTLTHPQNVVLKTPGRGKLLEAVAAVLGNDIARRLIPISFDNGNWKLAGYVSPPDLVRSTRQGETFIVNGRVIRSSLLSRSVSEAYHTLIPAKLNALAVLQLSLPPAEYDVNVHPAKMEIRFAREQELAQFISDGIRKILRAHHSPTTLEFASSAAKIRPGEKLIVRGTSDVRPDLMSRPTLLTNKHLSADINNLKDLLELTDLRANKDLSVNEKTIDVDYCLNSTNAEKARVEPVPSALELINVWPLAQVFNTYILATDGSNLVIIDQHAAHERINYERLLKQMKKEKPGCQELLIPVPLEFTVQEEQLLLEHLWTLREFGFILEHFGSRTYLLRGIPDNIQTGEGENLIRQFLEMVLKTAHTPSFDSLREEWVYLIACRNSIKAQENLSLLEMEQLLAQLNRTENPFTCPHGRPTIVQISKAELEKRFYRTN